MQIGVFHHLRPWQWYKNLLVFLPLVFSGNLTNLHALLFTFFGFILLCTLSSGNYMINDFFDWERDKYHKEKKQQLGKYTLLSLGLFLVVIALTLSFYFLSLFFSLILITLFVMSTFYSAFLKHIPFADILTISVNFVLRAISGAYIFTISNLEGVELYIWISPWLIICTFFLALFIATGKRYVEFQHQNKKFRPVLQQYTPEITQTLIIMSTTALIISYSLYSFLGEAKMMIITLPFALFTILRYLILIYQKNDIAEKPYRVIQDSQMVWSITLWILLSLIIIYGSFK